MAFLGRATGDYRFALKREMMDREGYDVWAFTQGEITASLLPGTR